MPKFNYKQWLLEYENNPKWPDSLTVVGILWTDATKGEDMDAAGVLLAFTPGVLMRADKKSVTVAHEVFDNLDMRDVTTVPRKMVKSITTFGTINF